MQAPGPVALHDEPALAARRASPACWPAGSGVRVKSRLRWYGVSFPGICHLPVTAAGMPASGAITPVADGRGPGPGAGPGLRRPAQPRHLLKYLLFGK